MISAEVNIQIPFHDADALEVAWHGHYVKYFEIARCAALDKINYNYAQMKESGYAWPIIDLHIRYSQAAVFGQWIRVTATLKEWENRMVFEYLVSDAKTGGRLSRGETTQVAVDWAKKEMCFISPPVLFQKLGLPQP